MENYIILANTKYWKNQTISRTNNMKEIAKLLSYKETINLGLALLCKKYNFELHIKRKHNESVHNAFISIIVKSLDIDKKIMYKSINKLKCQLRDNRHLFYSEYISTYVSNAYRNQLEIYWYTKD